jgi:hypothetical protein
MDEGTRKLNIEPPYDPAVPLLGVHRKEIKWVCQRDFTRMFIEALFTIARIWTQPTCPLMDRKCLISMYSNILVSFKK